MIVVFRHRATFTGFFRYTRVSPLQGATHCFGFTRRGPALPRRVCMASSLCAAQARRASIVVPGRSELFRAIRTMPSAAVGGFRLPRPLAGCGKISPAGIPVGSSSACRTPRTLDKHLHRGDRGQNSTMKMSRSRSCRSCLLLHFVVVSYRKSDLIRSL